MVTALSVFACAAQGGSISGIVVDPEGGALSGALVKLEKGGQTATTGTDGRFTLDGVSRLNNPVNPVRPAGLRIAAGNGLLFVDVAQRSPVAITVFTAQGRVVSRMQTILAAGSHSIALAPERNGVYLCKVESGADEAVAKVAWMGKGPHGAAPSPRITPFEARERRGKAAETIHDVIAVTKSGFLNYRAAVTNPDTAGIEIKMIVCEGTLSDTDGNEYQTVRIGRQVWMTENLRATKLNDGTPIALDTSAEAWAWAGSAEYCYYNNGTDADSIRKYGALYNWFAVETGNLAPAGWHVPTSADWDTLFDHLVANGYNYDGTTTGDKTAKSLAAQCDWNVSANTGDIGCRQAENNRSGFSALPGGYRKWDGGFLSMGYHGFWWSATMFDDVYADMRRLSYGSDYFFRNDRYAQNCGFSVRLVKDD